MHPTRDSNGSIIMLKKGKARSTIRRHTHNKKRGGGAEVFFVVGRFSG